MQIALSALLGGHFAYNVLRNKDTLHANQAFDDMDSSVGHTFRAWFADIEVQTLDIALVLGIGYAFVLVYGVARKT